MFSVSLALLNLFIVSIGAFAIIGISAGVDNATGERPFRQDILTFSGSGAAWDLYVLSTRQLQQINQNDSLSFFGISGKSPSTCFHLSIHGYPDKPWDGVNGTDQGRPGYCTHASVPFPVWHRPYIVLYEQILWTHAQSIARTYPSSLRDRYVAAAATLRVPYWDWAATPALPEVVTTPLITINTPDGMKNMDNPLFNYTFQSDAAGNGFPAGHPMAKYPTTVRHWNSDLNQSNNTGATQALLANGPTLLAMTYQLLTSVSNYSDFACTMTPGGLQNTGDNIENIHNLIHDCVGGVGHMAYPEVAGFDPVFWMHHAQVDRLFAMWQILNPNSWVKPSVNVFGTFSESPGFIDSAVTALSPFHSNDQLTLYTADTVRSTRLFGYTYPGLTDWNTTTTALAANVRAKVNALYNPTAKNATTAVTIASRNTASGEDFSHVTFDLAKELGVNNLDMQWSINIQLQRFASPTAFAIHFFMGNPPTDSSLWSIAPNLIGSHAQFIAANVTTMYPLGPPDGLLRGEISLTHTLAAGVARGILVDLTPPSVLPMLAGMLNWRARSADGREIDLGSLTDLSIAVGSRRVQPAGTSSDFPVYGAVQHHAEATHGKRGGMGQSVWT